MPKKESWKDFKKRNAKPERILYVNLMVAMSNGMILPKVIKFEDVPIELRGFLIEQAKDVKW